MATNPNNLSRQVEGGRPFSWHILWMIIAPRLGLFFLCFLTVLAITIAYLAYTPRLYESSATVQVELQEQRAFRSTDNSEQADDLKTDDVVKTIEQNLQNYGLFVNVVSNPKIAQDPEFLVGYPHGSTPTVSGMAEWLKKHTNVALQHGTRLIDINVDHEMPVMAQKLVQAIIDTFTLMNSETQNLTQKSALTFLEQQSDEVKANLQKSENALEIYKDTLLLKDRIEDQQRVIDALRQRYREKHPQLIQARALLASLLQTFDTDFQKVLVDSKSEAAYWTANGNDLASAPASDRVSTELKLVEARADVLQKQVDTESALFDNVLKQMRETDVTRDSAPTDLRVVTHPLLPEKPAKPRKMTVLLLGSAAGFLLGVAAMAAAFALDSSIQNPTEAEILLGLPVLGAIPRVSSGKKGFLAALLPFFPAKYLNPPKPLANGLIMISDPGSAAAEGFRSLRTVIPLLAKTGQRSLLFTSAVPGEGKTFVSCNYALSLAQAGLNTLLIDADLRRPSVHTLFRLENKIGVYELLTQGLDFKQAGHLGLSKNLTVLTSGGQCPNPAELLAEPEFRQMVARALAAFDRVVFDCSPVNLVSDSLLVAEMVDTVCLVVRADSTPRQAPVHAVSVLRRVQKEPCGFILNALPPRNDRLHLGYQSEDASAYRQNYA